MSACIYIKYMYTQVFLQRQKYFRPTASSVAEGTEKIFLFRLFILLPFGFSS